jgi:hypothetical protein
MSVTEDQGDVIIHRTPPIAAPSPALPPLMLSSPSSLTHSVEWISTPRTDSSLAGASLVVLERLRFDSRKL